MRPFLAAVLLSFTLIPPALRAADPSQTFDQIRQIRAEMEELQKQINAAQAQLQQAQRDLAAAEKAVNTDPADAERLRQWRYERVQLETERLNLSREKLRLQDARLALIKPRPEPRPEPVFTPPPVPLRPEYQNPPVNLIYRVTPYAPTYLISRQFPVFYSIPYYHTPYYRQTYPNSSPAYPQGYVSTPSTPPPSPSNFGTSPIHPTQWQGSSSYLNHNTDNSSFRLTSPSTGSNPSPYHLGPTGRPR